VQAYWKISRAVGDVLRLQADGWRATKLRLHDWTVKADIAQIEVVRRAVGEDFTLMVDAN
jgi:L-alanine-DL-glutamate epimerase-like enolase superfamily enzyme